MNRNEEMLGNRLWRIKYHQDWAELKRAVERLIAILMAEFSKLTRSRAHEIVLTVLAHWIDPRCQDCGGRGHKVVPGTSRLAKEDCGSCQGQGRIALPDSSAEARWMQRRVENLAARTAMTG